MLAVGEDLVLAHMLQHVAENHMFFGAFLQQSSWDHVRSRNLLWVAGAQLLLHPFLNCMSWKNVNEIDVDEIKYGDNTKWSEMQYSQKKEVHKTVKAIGRPGKLSNTPISLLQNLLHITSMADNYHSYMELKV